MAYIICKLQFLIKVNTATWSIVVGEIWKWDRLENIFVKN